MGKWAWLFFGIFPTTAPAAEPPASLGTISVHRRLANYKVEVPSCATFGERLVGLQLRVRGGTVYLERVILTYADRQTQLVKIGKRLPAGAATPWLDLGVEGFHDSRCVAEVFLTAKALAPGGPHGAALLEAFGQMQKAPQ